MNRRDTVAPSLIARTHAPRVRPSRPAERPAGACFVSRLLDSLTQTFRLDARERELARQLLCGHSLGHIARSLGVDTKAAQQRCRELFCATGSDGREQLFEIALRLTTMRELSSLFTA